MMSVLKNPYSKIILGIIWGFGLSCILAKSCKYRKCIIYKAPKTVDIEGKIYGHDSRCYKYTSVVTKCPVNPIES